VNDELFKIFREVLPSEKCRLLEIGSGSGHHAAQLCRQLRELQWVPSDVAARQAGLIKTVREAKLPNLHPPVIFEVGKDEFPNQKFQAAYASQVLHTMAWKQAKTLFKLLGNRLRKGSPVLFYGPFKYAGVLATPQEEAFDQALKAKEPLHGIRAFEDVNKAMAKAGFALKKDYTLSDGQHVLAFERLEHVASAD
jgi:hypothetical protein